MKYTDIKAALLSKMAPVTLTNITHIPNGNNTDIQRVLIDNLPKAVEIAAPIAPYFKGRTDTESLKKIHTFIRQNLGYRRDISGYQQIKQPNRFILESGDCKSNATFIYAICKNLGIPVDLVFTNYKKSQGKTPRHVYNVAFDRKKNKFVYVDGTSRTFGREAKKPNYKKFGNLMVIQTLEQDISGKGNVKKAVQKAKAQVKQTGKNLVQTAKAANTSVKKVVQAQAKAVKKVAPKVAAKVKTVGAVPARGAFLGLVLLNVRGYATKLQQADQKKLKTKWNNLGGNFTELQKAIKTGASKKPVLGINEDIGSVAAVGTSVAAATPIIIALESFLGKIENVQTRVEALKKSPSVEKVKTVLQKNPTLAKRLKGVTGAAKQKVIDQVSKSTGLTPSEVQSIVTEGKQTVAPEPGQTPEEVKKSGINTKLLLGLGLGAAALYAANQ